MKTAPLRPLRLALAGLLVAALAACASGPPPQRDRVTAGMAEIALEEGRTTQLEVLEFFGAPNIVARGRNGEESWTYERISFDSSYRRGGLAALGAGVGGSGGGGGAAAVSGGSSSSSVRTVTLIVTFDEGEVVKHYEMMETHF